MCTRNDDSDVTSDSESAYCLTDDLIQKTLTQVHDLTHNVLWHDGVDLVFLLCGLRVVFRKMTHERVIHVFIVCATASVGAV